MIPRNVRLSEAPTHGKPILLYDVTSKGCQSYLELAREVTQRLGAPGGSHERWPDKRRPPSAAAWRRSSRTPPPPPSPGGAVPGGRSSRCPSRRWSGTRSSRASGSRRQALEELAASIREHGVVEPILVRRDGGRYRILAGERRWRAAQRAGLKEVPAVVREASDREAFELALVENLQRADLNAIEEAEAYEVLIDDHGLTQEQIAQRVGKERSTVANALRLLKLPGEVRDHVQRRGSSTWATPGRSSALEEAEAIRRAAQRVLREGLSVRATEALVAGSLDEEGAAGAGARSRERQRSGRSRRACSAGSGRAAGSSPSPQSRASSRSSTPRSPSSTEYSPRSVRSERVRRPGSGLRPHARRPNVGAARGVPDRDARPPHRSPDRWPC